MSVDELRIHGVAAAPGLALAQAWQPNGHPGDSADAICADDESVRDAFAAVAAEFSALAQTMGSKGLTDEAAILTAESAIAADEELLADILAAMAAGTPAGRAIQTVGESYARMLEDLESAYLRERAADIRQVIRRALAVLAGGGDNTPPPKPFVLVDGDVGPVDLLQFAADGLAGAVSQRGGINAHAAIVARSLGIPLLLGIDPEALGVINGADVLVDGERAELIVHPAAGTRADATERIAAATDVRERHALERDLPAVTSDGRSVLLMCNVASAPEVRIGFAARAVGVGLLRTELPFLTAEHWPTERAHRDALTPIFEQLDGVQVTVRLLDFSNDKVPPFLTSGREGLDALLENPDALRAQLSAVLDVGRRAKTWVMLPMVYDPEQVTTVRAELRSIATGLGVPQPPLGIMIELPEAVDRAAELATVADFFSLGTNDLTASVLGLNRVDQGARPALAAHPRVLSRIVETCRAARQAGISVSVCGDAGGDPLVLPLLLAAGVRSLSVSPARVDEVRHRIRRINAAEWAPRLDHALTLADAESVWSYVEKCG
ncbi:MAG: multiphosphoryl transfer protein [Frankiaceae bacterium]|nr:multiphosphoryl transfer protein [Frankiaceae bacterium]